MPKTAGNHTLRAMIEIRQRIITGVLAGGMRLYEVPLAEMLRISRTPVREAMGRLAEEGLLDRARGGGYAVRAFGLADVTDAIELRGVLEGTAARLAAERGAQPAGLERVAAIIEAIDACIPADGSVDREGYASHNAAFHKEIAGLAGSDVIRRELERASLLPFAAPSSVLPAEDDETSRRRFVAAQEQHRAMVAAILAREGARAEAIAREHARAIRYGFEEFTATKAGRDAGLTLIVA